MKNLRNEKIREKLVELGDENSIEFFDNSLPKEVLNHLIEGISVVNDVDNSSDFTNKI
jgi:hypothetical protein